MLASFFSQPVVWSTSLVELLTILSVITFAVAAYRKIECHQSGCHRIGKFDHGHFKLCRRHHPLVPSSGKITQEHIKAAGGVGPPAQAPPVDKGVP